MLISNFLGQMTGRAVKPQKERLDKL